MIGISGWLSRWMDWMDRWIDGRTDGWMVGGMVDLDLTQRTLDSRKERLPEYDDFMNDKLYNVNMMDGYRMIELG